MKKNFLMLAIISSAYFVTHTAFSAPSDPPNKCPSIESIIAKSVSKNTIETRAGMWAAGRRSLQYDTNVSWTFILGNIPANNATAAYNKAITGLNTLQLTVGPLPSEGSKWVCMYTTQEGYSGATISPAIAAGEAVRFIN